MFTVITKSFQLAVAIVTFILFILVENYLFSETIKYLISEYNFPESETKFYGWSIFIGIIALETLYFVGNVIWRTLKEVFLSIFR